LRQIVIRVVMGDIAEHAPSRPVISRTNRQRPIITGAVQGCTSDGGVGVGHAPRSRQCGLVRQQEAPGDAQAVRSYVSHDGRAPGKLELAVRAVVPANAYRSWIRRAAEEIDRSADSALLNDRLKIGIRLVTVVIRADVEIDEFRIEVEAVKQPIETE